jgi:hypothetical protein
MKLEYNNLLVKHLELLRDYIDTLDSLDDLNEAQVQDLNDCLFDYQALLSIHKHHADPRVQRHVSQVENVARIVRAKIGFFISAKRLKEL